jgi:16S rRNA (cytosine967-C5)-methyltransferase
MAKVSAARELAFAAIRATFEQAAFTEVAFRAAAAQRGPGLQGRERALAQRLSYGAVQRRGTTDAAIERLAERSIRALDPPVLAALRLGLYELLFADATPDHAAVDQAVELVRRGGAPHACGLVNAVLRRASREGEALSLSLLADDSTPEAAAIAHSAPLWLAQMWWRELGSKGARALLGSCNEPAEVAMRVSGVAGSVSPLTRSGPDPAPDSREGALQRLAEAGVAATISQAGWPLGAAEEVVLSGRTGEVVGEMVAAGELTPQSRGSAAVVEVLDPHEGEHILDLCAGPGIKTGQIAARMSDRGEVISVEADQDRAGEVAAQARRLGLRSVTVIEADATQIELAAGFDRVLLDAPCSDLGALASRPDARWRKSPKLIERLVEIQRQALLRAARALRPGGILVYATCTISQRENEGQIAGLVEAASAGEAPGLVVENLGARAPDLASPLDPRCLQLRPDRDRTTGFFICRLKRDDDEV